MKWSYIYKSHKFRFLARWFGTATIVSLWTVPTSGQLMPLSSHSVGSCYVAAYVVTAVPATSQACPPPRRSPHRRNQSSFRLLRLLSPGTSTWWWGTTQSVPHQYEVIEVPAHTTGMVVPASSCWSILYLFSIRQEIAEGRTTTLQICPIFPNDGTGTS
jgi:hypothetical protein